MINLQLVARLQRKRREAQDMERKYPKLRGIIKEKYDTQAAFAQAIGMNIVTLNRKMSGKTDWTRQDIENAVNVLGIEPCDIAAYFFT
jgi:transcriptional regulator with XRE-family HTH domain